MNELENIFNIKKKISKPVYLFYSENSFLLKKIKDDFIKKYIKKDIRDFNFTFIEEDENFAVNLLKQANTLPFMSDKRYIIARTREYFTKKMPEDNLVIKLLENLPQTTILLVLVEGKIDNRLEVVSLLKKNGQIVKVDLPKYRELDNWIMDEFKKRGKKIDKKSVTLLEKMFNNNLNLLENEIEKITLLYNEKETINFQDVTRIISKSRLLKENTIFSLTDALIKREKGAAVRLLNDLVQDGVLPIMILSTIIWQLRLFMSVKSLKEENNDIGQIAKLLKSHRYPVEKCFKVSDTYTEEKLELILERFLEADYDMVTSKLDPKMALEMAILEI